MTTQMNKKEESASAHYNVLIDFGAKEAISHKYY